MGAKPTTIGGGSARGVSDALSGLLMNGLQGGFNFGSQQTAGQNLGRANPLGDTLSIGNALSTLLSGGSNLANSAMAIADRRRTQNVADLRARYALGGTGYGTPASSAEANFRAEYDPQVATQIGGMQLDYISRALSHILPLYSQAYGLGTPQAQTVMKKSGFMNALDTGIGIAKGVAPFVMPGLGAGMAAASSAAPAVNLGGQLGQASNYHFPGMSGDQGAGSYFGGFGGMRDSFGTPFNPIAPGYGGGFDMSQLNPALFSGVWSGTL